MMTRNSATATAKLQPGAGRVMSLDVFRGATIAAMILVNNAGGWPGAYAQLRHAHWHGWTFTDTVFPSFLWIVGVAITLSFARRLERGDSRGRLLLHVLRRAAIIFALGLLVSEFPHFDLMHLRVPGVLQRIAICYFIASILFLYTGWKTQAWCTGGLLAVYWLIVKFVPVPGYGAGIIDRPDGTILQYVDLALLKGFLYTPKWDPEGIISTVPALATTMFGILTARFLHSERTREEKAAWIFATGNLLIVAGAIMNIWLPINKNMWSSSFAVFMAGVSTSAFAFCYWIIDVQSRRAWSKPFAIFGMNAIAVYMLAEFGQSALDAVHVYGLSLSRFLFDHVYSRLFGTGLNSMMWGLSVDAVCFLVAWALYRKKWFLRV